MWEVMSASRLAFAICDDAATGAELHGHLDEIGWPNTIFADSRSFLSAATETKDVSFGLVDYYSDSGEPALQLLQAIEDADLALPLILVAKSPTLPFVAEAASRGASSILVRPFSRYLIEQAVDAAVAFRAVLELKQQVRQYARSLSQLTDRERKILRLAVDGWPNKRIAALLEVSVKTIERSRKFAYQKLNVRSSAEMARVVSMGSLASTITPKVSVLGPSAVPEPHVNPIMAPISPVIPPAHFVNPS